MDFGLLNAEKAYSQTLKARKNQEEVLYSKMIEHLNNNIVEAIKDGKMHCIDDWGRFADDDIFDTNLIDKFLKNILEAGYDVEFYYDSPSGYNPRGVVVVWGNNREKEIKDFFQNHPKIYKGEADGLH